MKSLAISLLNPGPETGNWCRVIDSGYIRSATSTAHTSVTRSRFYDPYSANPKFGSLYLSEDPLVAQFEAQVLISGGGTVLHVPRTTWAMASVKVSLREVVDLSLVASQVYIDTSVQELTGDWLGYHTRSLGRGVKAPTGAAPTQLLGEAIHADARQLEGFITVSAKVPDRRNLIVFPDHLRRGSFVEYEWNDGYRINKFIVDQEHINGREV